MSYSVEQVELMRRLRLTGITLQQIADGFDTLERLERELAPYQMQTAIANLANGGPPNVNFNQPMASLGSHHITAIKTLASPYDSLLSRFRPNGATPNSQNHSSGSSAIHVSRRKRSLVNAQFPFLQAPSSEENNEAVDNASGDGSKGVSDEPVWNPNDGQIQFDHSANSTPLDGSILEERRASEPEMLDSSVMPPQERSFPQLKIRRRRGDGKIAGMISRPMVRMPLSIDYSQYVDESQLDEFVSRGEMETLREIKEFVTARQIRQQTIATMTGISQPYVSRFLSGSGRELSARVRRLMYRWFLAVKNHPDLTTTTEMMNNEEVGPPTMVSLNNGAMFSSSPVNHLQHEQGFSNSIFPQSGTMFGNVLQSPSANKDAVKRERFIFKPVHVRLLHKYFALDPYPNIRKREEIAAACNKAYETLDGGKFVPPRERVNHVVIGNWFSNRRKEMKRRGEMRLRRMRGGKVNNVNRIEQTPTLPGSTFPSEVPIAEMSSLPMCLSHEADRMDEFTRRERSDLTNIVNELHAMGSSVLALANPYSGAGTQEISFKEENLG